MQLTFLGTSAANAFPEPFCRCGNCQQARALGGPSLRRRSSALVNSDLLIDFGPDVLAASNQLGVSLLDVQFCLITHAHADHFDPSHLLSRSPGYGVIGAQRLHLYASPGSLRATAQLLERDCQPWGFLDPRSGEKLNLSIHPIQPFETVEFGGYRVTAFPANHDPGVEPLLFAVESGGRSLFYGTDTSVLGEETWRAFHDKGLRFDLVAFDHTYGPHQRTGDHLSAHGLIEHMQRMRAEGLLAEGARVIATHIAHEGNPPHPQLVEFAREHGYEVAYDGLVVDIS